MKTICFSQGRQLVFCLASTALGGSIAALGEMEKPLPSRLAESSR